MIGIENMTKEIRAADRWLAITPSDNANLPLGTIKGIYIGGAGNVSAVDRNNNAVTFSNVTAGSIIPLNAKRINATGTTAANLVALYD